MDWEVEGGSRGRLIHILLWLIHVDVWQKPTEYCKAIILQLKINKKRKPPFGFSYRVVVIISSENVKNNWKESLYVTCHQMKCLKTVTQCKENLFP